MKTISSFFPAAKAIQTLKFTLVLSMFLFVSSPSVLSAKKDDDEDASGVPIDGGLSLLLGAGAAYGIKHFRKAKTDQLSNEELN